MTDPWNGNRPVERILAVLDGVRGNDTTRQYSARCPAHEDRRQSLSVKGMVDGTVLVNCHAGCTKAALFARFRELVPEVAVNVHVQRDPIDNPPPGYVWLSSHPYKAATGVVVYVKVRYRSATDPMAKTEKRWWHQDPTTGQWKMSQGEKTKLLYRLDELAANRERPRGTVVITEGEPDADAVVEQCGLLATTNPDGAGGAGKWLAVDDRTPLYGVPIAITPDHDLPGLERALEVYDDVHGAAEETRFVLLRGETDVTDKHGYDVRDYLAGHTPAEFERLIENAPEAPPAWVRERVAAWQADRNREQITTTTQADLTDAGNATRLWQRYGESFRWVPELKEYIVWGGNAWQVDMFGQIQEWAKAAALELVAQASTAGDLNMAKWAWGSRNQSRVRATLESTRSVPGVSLPAANLNMQRDRLPTRGGTYNLRTGQLEPARREDYFTECVSVTPQPGAPHPKWDEFLRLLFADDQTLIIWFRRVMGSWLTGHIDDKRFYVLFGDGDNGKSTLLLVLADLLSVFAHKVALEVLVERRGYGNVDHHKADCRGKRFIYTEEFGQHDRLNCAFVKDVTGGGMVTAARKYENAVTFPFIGKLVFATNVLPELPNLDKALAARVCAIPFTVNIPERVGRKVAQSAVIAELLAEAPGILDDLVQAAAEWYRVQGTAEDTLPQAVIEATEKYLLEQDIVKRWIRTCTEGSDGRKEERPFKVLYQSFLVAMDRDEQYVSKKWFGLQLERHGFEKHQRASGVYYIGPALTAEAALVARVAVATDRQARSDGQYIEGSALLDLTDVLATRTDRQQN